MSVAIKTISSLPYPEHQALEQAPVRWDIGEGKYHIRMATPLFSFAGLDIYKRACWAIKITMLDGDPMPLSRVLEYGAGGDDEEKTVARSIEHIIKEFQDKYKVDVIPQNICDIMLGVSHPLSWIEVHQVLTRYIQDKDLAWDIPKNPLENKSRMKELLRTFCAYELDIGDCCLVLVYLERINTEVKKKLLADEGQRDESRFSKASRVSQKTPTESSQPKP